MEEPEKSSTREKWLETGYRHFAEYGPDHLSINKMSGEIGAARASFYHHFGDLQLFSDELLQMHLKLCQDFDREAAAYCQKLMPDLYHMLARYPLGLKFNLHLFHHRRIPAYNYVFSKTFKSSSSLFALDLFSKHYGLKGQSEEVYHLWLTLAESWYSRLDPDDLSEQGLIKHSEAILKNFSSFLQSELYGIFQKS